MNCFLTVGNNHRFQSNKLLCCLLAPFWVEELLSWFCPSKVGRNPSQSVLTYLFVWSVHHPSSLSHYRVWFISFCSSLKCLRSMIFLDDHCALCKLAGNLVLFNPFTWYFDIFLHYLLLHFPACFAFIRKTEFYLLPNFIYSRWILIFQNIFFSASRPRYFSRVWDEMGQVFGFPRPQKELTDEEVE